MNKQLIALSLLGLFASGTVLASDTSTLTVKGTLIRPPCTLTSNTVLTANFGSLRYDQVSTAAQIDIPVTLTCPPNSVIDINVSAFSTVSDTVAATSKTNLGYSLLWKSDSSLVNIKGTSLNLTGLNGTVDLSMKAKLVVLGALSEGDFSATAGIHIVYR